jgi:endonuclease-3
MTSTAPAGRAKKPAPAGKSKKRAAIPTGEGERIRGILQALARAYPDAKTDLRHEDPLELLVATILSAQCTDERVNEVTKVLFREFRTAADYARRDVEELKRIIHSTGFYNNKAKNIQAMASKLLEAHGGQVPSTMEELVALPGVARKTANVVLGSAFGRAEGIVVDTHVLRLSGRLGLSTHQKNAEKVEADLMKIIPREDWIWFAHALVWHGRRVCKARKPGCEACPLNELCPSAFAAGN